MAWLESWRPVAAAVVASAALAVAGYAHAAGAFAGLGGTWSGSGQIRLENGRSEAIRCSANYVPRSGGESMGLSLRCASASNRIELRASLSSSGSRVSGSWEERNFNAAGSVTGVASGGSLRLQFSGSISGSMLVTTNGASQSISVRTDGTALKGVNVSLRRSN
jgi:hypothetical protein